MMPERKGSARTILISGLLCGFMTAVPQDRAASGKRETVLDRIIHLEKEFRTEIPRVGRLCDELDLVKKRIGIGDCELYVEEEGRGTPLVVINGGPGGTHHGFHPWFSRAGEYARVVYYDQRGCGLSDRVPGKDGYSVEQAVADLEALRTALRFDRWTVLGFSYGGLLAQVYAIKHPERLAGLVLLGAVPGMWIEMKPTRQYDFLSREERDRIREASAHAAKLGRERSWGPKETLALGFFNAHLNGDWKRQHFYRPTEPELARRT
jgi:proline iminopeptidase